MVEMKPQVIVPPEGTLPSSSPTIYCDGIANVANTAEVAKMYFYRVDPIVSDTSRGQAQVVAQVVMPLSSLVNMLVFLEKSVSTLVENGFIRQEQIENERKIQAAG